MGRLDQRLTELEEKQESVQLKINKLDSHMEAMGQSIDKKHWMRERKVILRDLTDINIRICNLQRSKKKGVNEEESKDVAIRAAAISGQGDTNAIDSKDENFDPEAIQFVHIRPEWRVYPKIPLPHAKPKWDRVARVWRGRGETGSMGSVVEGQFAGVEEEEMSGWEKLDCHVGNNRISRTDAKALFLQEPSGNGSNETVASVMKSTVSIVPAIAATYSEPVTPATIPANSVPNTTPKCICHQPLHLLTCSSVSCGHCFYGRVMNTCRHHPTDHYMLDQPTMCPICKAVPLLEDSSLTPPVPDQIVTKIKSKPVLERKVFSKSLKQEEPRSEKEPSRVNKLANDDQVLVSVEPGKMLEKAPSAVPRLQKNLKCEEADVQDYKVCAAKTVDVAPVQAGGVGGDLLAFRERLRRRLIVTKNARRGCGQEVVQ